MKTTPEQGRRHSSTQNICTLRRRHTDCWENNNSRSTYTCLVRCFAGEFMSFQSVYILLYWAQKRCDEDNKHNEQVQECASKWKMSKAIVFSDESTWHFDYSSSELVYCFHTRRFTSSIVRPRFEEKRISA